MDGDETVTANFAPIMYTVTAAVSGSGTVTSDLSGIDCGADCDEVWAGGTVVMLTATPDQYHEFVGWSGGSCDGETSATCVITVDGDETLTANFAPIMYTVTAAVSGSGTVTSDLPGIDCGADCDESWQEGTLVTLTATPDQYHEFVGWSGGSCDGETSATCAITVDGDETVTANFAPIMYTVAVAVSGSGTVTSDLPGIDCGADCDEVWQEGTLVTLTATPDTHHEFVAWSGGPCDGDTNPSCAFMVSTDENITATFQPILHTVTVVVIGPTDSGTVTGDAGGIACPGVCSADLPEGSQLTLTASSVDGWQFTNWSGGPCDGSTTDTCLITVDRPVSITATYLTGRTLTVTNGGGGMVTSDPAGVNCGGDCSESWLEGTVITLTATPDDGYVFDGWTGDVCAGTSQPCQFTLSDDTDVGASFSLDPSIPLPADTYFSLAVTEDSHNHVGAKRLFLAFERPPFSSPNDVTGTVVSAQVAPGEIQLDGAVSEWDQTLWTNVTGLVQNNYPLSEFLDGVTTPIQVTSAWDEDRVYFAVRWEDAGHTESTRYKKWIYGDQGNGESGWNGQLHLGATAGAPNEFVVNATGHELAGLESEDRLFLMFPIVDSEGVFAPDGPGCAAYCHANHSDDNPGQNYTGTDVSVMHANLVGDAADIWHWKAARTGPSGCADDKYIDYATGTSSGRRADSGSAAYGGNGLVGSDPEWMHSSGLSYTGDDLQDADKLLFAGAPLGGEELPSNISLLPSGSRGDVEAVGAFDVSTNTWTVEMRRRRDTGDALADHSFEGNPAQAPVTALVGAGDPVFGETLYDSPGNQCYGCHGLNGEGFSSGSAWSVPRVQRSSGAQIVQALNTVPAMSWLSVDEQEAEDIAAWLQTQATFAPTWTVDVTVNGPAGAGVVTSDPPGIDCAASCAAEFLDGTPVTLAAANVAGWTFTGWSGPCSGTGPCSFTVNADTQVTANYQSQTTNWTLTVVNGGGGVVNNTSGVIDCGSTCTEVLSDGSQVTLVATPDAGYVFSGWTTGPCGGGTGPCSFAITQDETVTAAFSPVTCGSIIYDQGGTNGFGRVLVVDETSLNKPTAMVFLPNDPDAFLVTEQTGSLLYFNDWACTPVNSVNVAGVLPVYPTGGEPGLVGMVLHPDFASNGYVFLYHSSQPDFIEVSVSRMTATFNGGALQLGDAVRIIDFRKNTPAPNHNGGGLVFAPDGTLLASVGEGGWDNNSVAGFNTNLLGSVVRIEPSLTAGQGGYTIPAGNMFPAGNPPCDGVVGSSSACPEILAMGLRNPFRMSMADNVVYIGDVGAGYEEINSFDYTDSSVHFGWPGQDGPGGGAGMTDPIMAYSRGDATAIGFRAEDPMGNMTGCVSVISGDVYRALGGDKYGGLLTNRLLFSEWYDAFVRGLGVDASGGATGLDLHLVHREGVTDLVEGPDGYIYLVARRMTGSGCTGTATATIYRLVRP